MHDMTGVQEDPNGTPGGAVRPEIKEIFAELFLYTDELHMQTSREDVDKWDSLQHVALITSIESAFGITLSMDEIMEIMRVSDIHTILERHGV